MTDQWHLNKIGLWEHPLERSLEGLPVAIETPQVIHDYYMSSTDFMLVINYDRDITLLENEIGCVLAISEDKMLPILRICVKAGDK